LPPRSTAIPKPCLLSGPCSSRHTLWFGSLAAW
jgi:hypothetical protein